jgi:hypothetical protein
MTAMDWKAADDLAAAKDRLGAHRVFALLDSMDHLRRFMRWHVFCVWDFMTLLKRLQRELTCTNLPWVPPQSATAARLINEIVVGEECDVLERGGFESHYGMYLAAMKEVGADTAQVDAFIGALRGGADWREALSRAGAPPAVREFVASTLTTAMTGSLEAALGSFFFGRENVIPAMFRGLLRRWGIGEEEAPVFVYYLKRHIELDSDSHGPAARRLILEVTRGDPARLAAVEAAARTAMGARLRLWDSLAQDLSAV